MQMTNTATWTQARYRNGGFNHDRHWLLNADVDADGNLRLKAPTRFYNNDADATGYVLDIVHDSASPADSDVTGTIRFIGDDSGGTPDTGTFIRNTALTVAAGDYTTRLSFFVADNDTSNEAVRIEEDHLFVDNASPKAGATSYVNTFDAWDDAFLLQMHNDHDTDREEFWRRTDEIGITRLKDPSQGEAGGRMMDLAKGIKLGWGAAAQNREAIDQVRDVVKMVAKETLGLDDPFVGLPLNRADRGAIIDVG